MQLGHFLMKKTIFSLAIRVGGVGLGFVAYVLLARTMSTDAYGDFIYFVNLVALVALVAQGGFQTSILRYAHAYHAQPALLAGFMRTSMAVPVFMAAILTAAAYIAATASLLPEIIERVITYSCVCCGLFALTYVAQQSLKAFGRIVASQIFEQIGLPLCLIIAALFAMLHGNSNTPFAYTASVYCGVFAATTVITWGILMFYHYPRGVQPQYRLKTWLNESATMGLIGVISTAMLRMDVLIIGLYLTSEDVAQYGVSARVAALLAFVYAALGNSLTPTISEKFHQGTLDAAMPLVRKLMRMATALNIAVLLGIVLLREPILQLFGEHYMGAAHVLIVLACAQALNISAGPLGSILSITGHHRAYMLLTSAFAALLLVALWLGTTHYGVLGAAYAVAIVNVAMHAALMRMVVKKTGIRTL